MTYHYTSQYTRRLTVDGLKNWAGQWPVSHNLVAVTLSTNWDKTNKYRNENNVPAAMQSLKNFDYRVNKLCFGRKSCLVADKRQYGFATIEHPKSNIHWHCILSIRNFKVYEYSELAKIAWNQVCPSGSLDVQEIYNFKGWAKYISKDAYRVDLDSIETFYPIPDLAWNSTPLSL